MFDKDMQIAGYDEELWTALENERRRQEDHIELIASENFVSPAVMATMGSVMTNKYAEGYPGKRYYGGCEFVDEAEKLARVRAKKLFGAEHANVQPHSGAQANMGVYFATLQPGDSYVAMSLNEGGHLRAERGRFGHRGGDDQRAGDRSGGLSVHEHPGGARLAPGRRGEDRDDDRGG